MPCLRDLLDIARAELAQAGHKISDRTLERIAYAVRAELGGGRVYVSPINSRKDPERKDRIRQAASKLPTGVAAESVGVSLSYAYRVTRPKK